MPTPKARRKDGKTSRKTASILARGVDWVAIGRNRSRRDTEDKAQRRQNVAKNGIDLGANTKKKPDS